jgi:hypothetical protein
MASNEVSTFVFSMRTIVGCRLSVLAKYLLIQDARPLVVVQSGNSSMCTCRIVPHRYRPQVKVSSRLFNTSLNASLLLDLAVKYENRTEIKSDVMRDAEISHRRHIANQNRESVVASEDEMLIESNMKM